MYIGDMAQQTQFGTIQSWDDVEETIDEERQVQLEKVYRNTKQILSYIASLGYNTTIDEKLKEGPNVQEFVSEVTEEQVAYISKQLKQEKDTVGILGVHTDLLSPFATLANEHVHVMTMHEAQGVEFDTVFIVGVSHDMFATKGEAYATYGNEKQKVNKDLLYVALTRAMTSLYIVGNTKLARGMLY